MNNIWKTEATKASEKNKLRDRIRTPSSYLADILILIMNIKRAKMLF